MGTVWGLGPFLLQTLPVAAVVLGSRAVVASGINSSTLGAGDERADWQAHESLAGNL